MNTIQEIRLFNMRALAAQTEGGKPAFAKKIKIAYVQLNNYIGKKPIRNIGNIVARRTEEILSLPEGWLDTTHEDIGVINALSDDPTTPLLIPLFDLGKDLVTPDVAVTQLTVTRQWVHENLAPITDPLKLRMTISKDDAMQPTYFYSDILFIDTGATTMDVDGIYMFYLNGVVWVRRLQHRPDGSLLMISDNKQYEPYTITADEHASFVIKGRLCGVMNFKRV